MYLRNDLNGTYSGTWTNFIIASPTIASIRATQVRSLGTHVDSVTGVQYVFAGVDPLDSGLAGIFSGTFNNTSKTLSFSSTPEFTLTTVPVEPISPADLTFRVMAMTECNGAMYASIGLQIFKRTDGVSPTWSLWATESLTTNLNFSVSGYRGLSCVTGSDGVTNELLMTTEGSQAWVVAYNTTTAIETVEEKLTAFVNDNLGLPSAHGASYMICSYNHIDPVGFDNNYLIGCEAKIGQTVTPPFTTPLACTYAIPNEVSHYCQAFYFHRNNTGTIYTWHQLPTSFPGSVAIYPTTSVRGTVASPFPGDRNVTFMHGYDANTDNQINYILPTQPTAWVYRVQTLPGDVFP